MMKKGMYLFLGQSLVVPKKSVVGVVDLDNTSTSHLTRAFLRAAEKSGRVVNAAQDLPKSFVVCAEKKGEATVYLSQLNSATLLRRAESESFE